MTEQAGAIIVNLHRGTARVLLVTAKRNPAQWVFPKGHIEAGETLEETALREAEEEAGVRATIVARVGSMTFSIQSESFNVHYFLTVTDDDGQPEKGRRLKWCTFEDALERLSFENSRELLRKAWDKLPKSRT